MKYEETKKSTKYEARRNKKSSILQTSDFTLQKGVSLYLALMIMFILIAIGLGVSLIIVSQMKMIRGMGDSVVAFYAGDTGIEHTLYETRVRGSTKTEFTGSLDGADYQTTKIGDNWKSVGNFEGVKRAVEISYPPPPVLLGTLYMHENQHTVNGLNTYELGAGQTSVKREVGTDDLGNVQVLFSIRVYVRHNDGSLDPLSDWSYLFSRPVGDLGEGIQSGTWAAPETNLASTDAIQVTIRIEIASVSWPILDTDFITKTAQELGISKINSGTWNVYLYTGRDYDSEFKVVSGYFYWGVSPYDSRIEIP